MKVLRSKMTFLSQYFVTK